MLPFALRAAAEKPRRILLRSSWQTVNIGDIGHTPGILRLLGECLPQAEITLWPNDIGNGVEAMLRRNFPALRIAKDPESIRAALAECDFMLHGSGPSLVGRKELERWASETGKPYGIYGITWSAGEKGPDARTRALLDGAQFLYFRDTISLQSAKDAGLKTPILEFTPDAAFAVNLRNDETATAFLKANQLEDGKYVCVIPRYRNTPYWEIRHKAMTPEDERKQARNEQMKEHDHAPLRDTIVAVARQTSMKVLVCPEDESQMAIGKAMLVDPLPDDVKAKVVWHEHYWLTDEAVSTYARSAGLFGLEMHSPIMCIGNGIPAIVCRFKEQTSKGQMWSDVGLGEWLFDMDEETDGKKITAAVLAMIQEPAAARAKAAKAREFVEKRERETMAVVGKAAGVGV